jgi:hypothetical protein
MDSEAEIMEIGSQLGSAAAQQIVERVEELLRTRTTTDCAQSGRFPTRPRLQRELEGQLRFATPLVNRGRAAICAMGAVPQEYFQTNREASLNRSRRIVLRVPSLTSR